MNYYKNAGLLCFVLGMLLLVPSALQVVSAADIGEQSVDFHYRGEIEIDPASGHLVANWSIDIFDGQETSLTFALLKTLGDIHVEGETVTGFEIGGVDGMDNLQSVTINLVAGAERKRSFQIRYSGILLPEPMDDEINAINKRYIELNVDSFWFPIDTGFDKYLTASVDVFVGETGWEAVASGDTETRADGTLHVENTIPNLDVAFVLSKHFEVKETPRFSVYDLRKQKAGTNAMIKAANRCYDFLNPAFGGVDPLPVGRLVIHERPESGYARFNYIALTNVQRSNKEDLTGFLCHELTHYWSRHGNFQTVENWLNEGFAVYAELMAVRAIFGEKAFDERISRMQARIKDRELPSVWDAENQTRRPYVINYIKGPLALQMLEARIGSDAFMRFIQAYMAGRVATTPDLLDILEATEGPETRTWFQALLAE